MLSEDGIAPVANFLVAGPVVVVVLSASGSSASTSDEEGHVETVAVGSLHVWGLNSQDQGCAVAVGDSWAFPLRPGTSVLRDGPAFLLPTHGKHGFAIILPPSASDEELSGWLEVLELTGCWIEDGCVPVGNSGVTHLGTEWDSCDADEIEFAGVHVKKGQTVCKRVALDERGWFYWLGTKGKRERTRPRWRETNCVICRRGSTGRSITWECYHVPEDGEVPSAASASLMECRAQEAEANKALWDQRKATAQVAATKSLWAVAAIAPYVAQGTRLAAKGAAAAIEMGGDVVSAIVPPADERVSVDPEVSEILSAVHEASKAGAAACSAANAGIEKGASAAGRMIGTRINRNDSTEESDPADTRGTAELGDAGSAAVEGVAGVFQEIGAARKLLRKTTAKAVCATVGSRYGEDAGRTLEEAVTAFDAAQEFQSQASGLSHRNVAKKTLKHGVVGATGNTGDRSSSSSGGYNMDSDVVTADLSSGDANHGGASNSGSSAIASGNASREVTAADNSRSF